MYIFPFIFERCSHFSSSVDNNDWVKMTVNNDTSPIKRWSASIYLEYGLSKTQLSDSNYRMLTMIAVMLHKPQKLPLRILAASVLLSWSDTLAGEPHWQTLSAEWSNRVFPMSQVFSRLCHGVRIWMVRSGTTQHQIPLWTRRSTDVSYSSHARIPDSQICEQNEWLLFLATKF